MLKGRPLFRLFGEPKAADLGLVCPDLRIVPKESVAFGMEFHRKSYTEIIFLWVLTPAWRLQADSHTAG